MPEIIHWDVFTVGNACRDNGNDRQGLSRNKISRSSEVDSWKHTSRSAIIWSQQQTIHDHNWQGPPCGTSSWGNFGLKFLLKFFLLWMSQQNLPENFAKNFAANFAKNFAPNCPTSKTETSAKTSLCRTPLLSRFLETSFQIRYYLVPTTNHSWPP